VDDDEEDVDDDDENTNNNIEDVVTFSFIAPSNWNKVKKKVDNIHTG
jgi:hypothetical protein